jgi:hypothetical protein
LMFFFVQTVTVVFTHKGESKNTLKKNGPSQLLPRNVK